MEKNNSLYPKFDTSSDPIKKLANRIVHISKSRQHQLLKLIIDYHKGDKDYMQEVFRMVHRSPALELELSGRALLLEKIENWMEKRLLNFPDPNKMTPRRLADECQSYYMKTWKKPKSETTEKESEPTAGKLVTESQKRFRIPQRMKPLLWKIARKVKDRVAKREKKKNNKSMQMSQNSSSGVGK